MGHQPNLDWDIHAKPSTVIDCDRVTELAEQCPQPLRDQWRRKLDDLTKRSSYPKELNVDLKDSGCALGDKHFKTVVDNDYVREIAADKVEGVIKTFIRGEWNKMRNRWLNWTKTINKATTAEYCRLTSFLEALTSVHDGDLAYSIDIKACYNQYRYGEELWPLVCFKHKGKWWHLTRMAMGQRQTSGIAQTALQVLSHGTKRQGLAYVDNLKAAGNREDLLTDLIYIRKRAEYCNMVFGEDLSKPEDLISEIITYLGLILDHKNKTVQIADKTIAKIREMMKHRGNWTLSNFISAGALLMYFCLATRRPLGRFQYAIQCWAAAQGRAQRDPNTKKMRYIESEDLIPVLTEWLELAIKNEPFPVAKREEDPIDFYVITDSCIDGYGGCVVSAKSGQCTILSGLWRKDLREYCRSSSRAEPLGMLCVLSDFFDRSGTHAIVQHYGDNQGSEHITNKGYSTKSSQIVMELLERELPGIKVKSKYTPGASIPADRVSRQLAADPEELRDFCKDHDIKLDEEFGRLLLSPTPKLI